MCRKRSDLSRRARAVAALVSGLALLAACGEPGTATLSWDTMETTAAIEVHTRTRADAPRMAAEIRQRIDASAVELDPASDRGALGLLNRQAGDEFHDIRNGDLYRCLNLALDYAKESGGAYDPTLGVLTRLHHERARAGRPLRPTEIDLVLPRVGWEKVTVAPEATAVRFRVPGMSIDLGEVGRGCALDWAARVFARPGSLGGRLRLGGSYRVWGRPTTAEGWRVSIPDPRRPDVPLLRLEVADRGVAVAGHRLEPMDGVPLADTPLFLDGRTGRPASTDLLAVVAVADSAADAAALAHALFVAGSLQGPSFLVRTRRTEAILVVGAGAGQADHVVASGSLEGRIELADDLAGEVGDDLRYLLPPREI